MATRRTIDLGTVGFGLVPETRALEQSLTQLRKFGREVERLGTFTEDAVQKQYRKFAQVERTLTSLHARTSQTISRMREAGIAAQEIDKIDQAYKRLVNTMTRGADLMTKAQFQRGVVGMGAMLSVGNRLASQKEVSGLATSFRELERAAILAVGPLSGIGARLAVLAALFDSVGGKMTFFIAGVTGVVAGFGLLAAASVKAVMDMQRFDAMLEASTGAAVLNAEAYEFLLQVSNRLGQNVRTLVEPYAKFTTAARLSNVALEEQRKIFEAAMIAGTAQRLNSERMSLVFLALEQMISKGTVSMEELRRQLGDLIPASFELSAKAMGVTTSELSKMIKNGEVLSKDLLPRLAEQWVLAFGPSAQKSAQTLQAELSRVGTVTFTLLNRFDQMTGFSELFRKGIVATREALEFLTKNMENVVALFGALVGAGVGMAALSLFSRLPTIIMATVTAVRALTAAIIALDLATLASGWGSLLMLLVKGAVVIGSAVAGFKLLKSVIEDTHDPMEDWLDQTKSWLDTQEKIGKSHAQTTAEIRKGTQERLNALTVELTSQYEMLRLMEKGAQIRKQETTVKPSIAAPFGGAFLNPLGDKESPDVTQQKERVAQLEALRKELQTTLQRLAKLQVDVPKGGTDVSTQWETWTKKIQELIRTHQGLQSQIAASEISRTAMKEAEGMAKAIELMADMPEKGRGSIEPLMRALRDAGFEGKNLTEQLAGLFTEIERGKDKIREIEALPQKMQQAGESIRDMFEKLEARRVAATVGDPEDLANQKQLEQHIVTLTEHLSTLRLEQEKINYITGEYRRQWSEMVEAERTSKTIKELTKDLEQLEYHMGDKGQRVMKEYADRVELVWRAYGYGIITLERMEVLLVQVQDDMNRKIVDSIKVFGQTLRDLFRDIEDTTATVLARMTLRQDVGWKQLFDTILQHVYEFMYKIMVIQPIMESLFGQLYTGRSGTGPGLFEPFLRGLAPPVAAGLAGSQAVTAGGIDEAGFIGIDWDAAARMQHGGSFHVPGSGGADSKLIAFRATPNERVDILTPEQQRAMSGGGANNIKVVVRNETGVPVEGVMGGTTFDPEGAVVELFLRRARRDAGVREQLTRLTRAPR